MSGWNVKGEGGEVSGSQPANRSLRPTPSTAAGARLLSVPGGTQTTADIKKLSTITCAAQFQNCV